MNEAHDSNICDAIALDGIPLNRREAENGSGVPCDSGTAHARNRVMNDTGELRPLNESHAAAVRHHPDRFRRPVAATYDVVVATPEQFHERRPGAATPIAGLFLAGASMRAGHGIIGAMTSGVQAADRILGDGCAARLLGGRAE